MAGARLKWEEPPGGQGGLRKNGVPHKPIADRLKRKPGTWAHVLTYDRARTSGSIAQVIRDGTTRAWAPAGTFEATANKVIVGKDKVEYRVYARYVGQKDG